ncbi:hypothetical protein ZIOFF_039637 [Zingiber officinale]|uniref:phosphoribosyl-ATP diphosphatase n=1 Tax=Zingiber officinale TaxID=94328 RepID=A0A8J5L0B5_ZINOF|nr:hypothetical protein ZIOFF_039637 [Zingiber officinale]
MDELANKAAEIRKRFDEITKEWKLLKLPKKAGKRKRSPMLSDMNRETGSLVVESDVLGREEEKDVLVKWLLSEDDTTGNGVSVIAVIGMGGLGKTTLAQLVYNDQRVKSYFDLTGWVCVSENFHVVSLTEKILQSFTKVKVHEELDELQRALQENLQGKRFLLVLDDVWNDNFCLWEQLKKPLLSAIAGKVIVTTRNHSVARIMQTTRDSLKLNVLPFDVCWSLFKKVTLGGADRSLRPDLEDIGRRIVEKCKGLPLAAKLIGGALRNEEDKESWTDIIESEIWKLDDRNIEVSPALQISYDCMLIQLKRCFQYLSLFPKDTSLSSKRIVQLWMPQGIFPLDGDKRAEDIGSDYIKRLVERSMLNPEEGSYFSMHDLVHDLAQYVAQDECLCVIDNNFDRKKLQEIRHLSVNGENIKLCQDKTNFLESDNLFQKLKYIRALDLNYMNITKLPDSLGNLKLLRYLSIEYTNVRSLPESICNLYNLQILHAESVYTLPRHIGNLINLRHLWFSHQVVFLPSGIGNLTNLQTLNHFSVSREEEHCNIGELNSLMKLGGSISIDNIGEVNNFSNSKFPLKTKKYLDSLELYWYDWFDYADEKKAEWQLEYLEPHVNLKTLEITKYPGIKFVGWVGASSFTKLIKLILRNCKNCSKLPPLGQLPSLEELEIIGMDGVQHVGREFCSMLIPSPSSQGELNIWKMDDVQHVGSGISSTLEPFSSSYKIAFPSLKLLLFSSMKNWKAWDGIQSGDFPNLHFIEIYECSKLINFPKWPLLPSVKEMSLLGCGALDVSYWVSLTNLKIDINSQEHSEWMSKSCFPMLQHLILSIEEVESVRLSQKRIPSLKTLEIRNSPTLRVVAGLKNLTSLNSLIIEACPNLEFKGLPATLEQVKLSRSSLFEKGYKEQQHMPNDLHALYVRADNDNILLVSLYVDDLIVTGSSPQMIKSFKEAMAKAFDMTDMGLMSYFLGLEVKQGVDGIFMTQEQYAKEVLKRFRMDDCNPVNTPVDCGTKLSKNDEGKTVDPTHSDWGGDCDDRRSTSGFAFFVGDTTFSWMSKKQPIVTLSTCEAEYIAASSYANEAENSALEDQNTRVCRANGILNLQLQDSGLQVFRGKLFGTFKCCCCKGVRWKVEKPKMNLLEMESELSIVPTLNVEVIEFRDLCAVIPDVDSETLSRLNMLKSEDSWSALKWISWITAEYSCIAKYLSFEAEFDANASLKSELRSIVFVIRNEGQKFKIAVQKCRTYVMLIHCIAYAHISLLLYMLNNALRCFGSYAFREEASELVETLLQNEDKTRTASEMADLIYHAMVLLKLKDVKMEEVLEVLRKRFSQSGIEEKSSRKRSSNQS